MLTKHTILIISLHVLKESSESLVPDTRQMRDMSNALGNLSSFTGFQRIIENLLKTCSALAQHHQIHQKRLVIVGLELLTCCCQEGQLPVSAMAQQHQIHKKCVDVGFELLTSCCQDGQLPVWA